MSKWTNLEIADMIESEGLGYGIQHYLSHENIADEWLSSKWKQCSELMDEIEKYLEKDA